MLLEPVSFHLLSNSFMKDPNIFFLFKERLGGWGGGIKIQIKSQLKLKIQHANFVVTNSCPFLQPHHLSPANG